MTVDLMDLNGKSEQINLISIIKHDFKLIPICSTSAFDDNIVIRGLLTDDKIMGIKISKKQ